MQSIENELRSFIKNTFVFGDGQQEIGVQESFLERGIIDSTGVLELVQFVEETYGIKVEDEELVPENLDSISQLTRFIGRKTGAPATAQQTVGACS